MKRVSKTYHLAKRGEVWHYHRRVPTALVSVIGKQFIKKSLGVKDLKSAQRLRNAFDVKVDAEFLAAENAPADSAIGNQSASLETLTEYLREHVDGLDARKAARLLDDPPEDEAQRKEMKENVEVALDTLRKRENPNGEVWVDQTSADLLKGHGAHLDDKQIVTQFAEVVRRGLMELQHRTLDRLDHRYDRSFHDPLFDPERPSNTTFGELVEIYWAEVSEDYRQNGVSPKSADRKEAQLSFFVDALGKNTPLTAITDDTVQTVRKVLSTLPANRKKLFPKLSIQDAIAQGEKQNLRLLDPTTQAQYLRVLSSVLAVAFRKGLIRHNPVLDVKPIKKSKLSAKDKRLPWIETQVIQFFTGKFYQQCKPDAQEPYKQPDRGWRF